jgi:hypothetical protein
MPAADPTIPTSATNPSPLLPTVEQQKSLYAAIRNNQQNYKNEIMP